MAQLIHIFLLLGVFLAQVDTKKMCKVTVSRLTSEGFCVIYKGNQGNDKQSKCSVANTTTGTLIWTLTCHPEDDTLALEIWPQKGETNHQNVILGTLSEGCRSDYMICQGSCNNPNNPSSSMNKTIIQPFGKGQGICKINNQRSSMDSKRTIQISVNLQQSTVKIEFNSTVYTHNFGNQTDYVPGPCLVSEERSWIDALEYCRNMDSFLVEITNDTVKDEVITLLTNKTSLQKWVWVGLERSIFGTKWKWISGSNAENIQWNDSFPVNRLNNHCGKVFVNESKQIQYLDGNCHDKLPFICNLPFC